MKKVGRPSRINRADIVNTIWEMSDNGLSSRKIYLQLKINMEYQHIIIQ